MSVMYNTLLQEGGIKVGEPAVEYENMTESDVSSLIYMALQDGIMEGVLEELSEMPANTLMEGTLPDNLPVLEVSIVRLDKNAKKQKAYKLAILQCARDDENKDFKKLETIWRMEKFLFRKLEKRYATKARTRMKQSGKKASGKNGVIAKAKSVLNRGGETRSQKETKKALAGQTKPPSEVKKQFNAITQKLGNKVNAQTTSKGVK